MELYGKNYSVKELRRRVGNMDQIAGVRTVQLDDGNERPTRAAIIHTGSGLEITVLLDRGLDIAAASHCGRAMGWRSTTGNVAPQYFEAEGLRWLRSYFGGLLTTCGLTNVGAPAPGSELHGRGLHGRIGNIPARNLRIVQEWQGNDYVLCVQGTMREVSVFGENLSLTRSVVTVLGENRFWIRDVLTNEGFNRAPYMLLYHCNLGWPVVDAGSRLIAPSRFVAPRDAEAKNGMEKHAQMDGPTHGYAEKCYYHDMAPAKDGSVTAAIVNDGFKKGHGFGAYVRWHKDELPRFVQWKQMGEQEYVCGIEPCTCGIEGRAADEKHGLQNYLKPGESREFNLEFGAITHPAEVQELEKAAARVKTTYTESYLDFVKPAKRRG